MLQSKTINSSLSLYVWSALNSLALILQQTSTICNMQVLQFYGNSIYIILFIANCSRNSIVSLYLKHANTHAIYCNAFKCFVSNCKGTKQQTIKQLNRLKKVTNENWIATIYANVAKLNWCGIESKNNKKTIYELSENELFIS